MLREQPYFQTPVSNVARDLPQETEEEPPGTKPGFRPEAQAKENSYLPFADTAESLRGRIPHHPRTQLKTRIFRRRFYPGVPDRLWNDWRWQVGNRVYRPAQLEAMLRLSPQERGALSFQGAKLPLGITPYYMSLLDAADPRHALRRTVVPSLEEFIRTPGEAEDPLGEESQSPVPGLVHRYPDRVLLLLTDFCSTYCRYCTRSRVVGHGMIYPSKSRLSAAIDYIRRVPTIRDVLISGGDPLTLSDERLDWLLTRLRQIPHVELLRIGTKIPAVLPQRITPKLVRMLRRHHPLWMSLHFTHPEECTPESTRACARLADAGIPLGSQTVLLQGVNDTVETMRRLVHGLLQMRVRPYYLYQCDPIVGTGHFRTPVERGLEMLRGLRGFTSGYAVPTYVVDAPGGGGKIPLMPESVVGREGDTLLIRNYQGEVYRYPDRQSAPVEEAADCPPPALLCPMAAKGAAACLEASPCG